MSETITDRDLNAIGENNMAACAGLTITDGGICLQRTELELPQSVTVAGALNNEGESSPVVFLNFVDKEAWSEGKIATAAELIAGRYSKFNVSIATEKPAEGAFYTICIGTTEALKEYAASQGFVFDPEKPEASSKTGFAVVEKKEHSAISPVLLDMIDENTIETDALRSIGDQLSALLADECPGISDYSPVTLFSESNPVVYLNFVDKDVWSTGKIATAAELIAGRYSKFKLNIVTEKPAEGDFYTVCIGTTEALKEYATSQGLVFDPENPDAKTKTAFAEVNRDLSQNMGDQFVDTYTIMSIGDQLSALLADECPGIGDYSPITLFSVSDYIDSSGLLAKDYGEGWSAIGLGDFNGNGTKDVLVANPAAASDTVGLIGYWENDSEWNLIGGYSPEWDVLATADFNGDGKTDILWRNSFAGEDGNTYNAYCTWIMDEADNWRMVSVANPDEWNFLCSGDFNGDKTVDIAMINDVGVVGIWGVNDGYLSSWSILSAAASEWEFAGVGDFNGDGTDDIAWCNTETGLTGYWQINNKELAAWANIATIG